MQHLLDFIHEHSLDQQLFLVVETPEGALSLTWRRNEDADGLWDVSPASGEQPGEQVHYGDLLDHLEVREVDLAAFERELRAIVLTHIAVADIVLRDARRALGPEVVQQRLLELRATATKLSAAQARVQEAATCLTLIQGEAVMPSARIGRLKLIRRPANP
ncbi:MAG TPA: hypothetical protein VFN67_16885 [Polyangiales bacterium]|jgi:hypothetical protein|nr:hypothetical protein [Polyangiales bacterium]